MELWRRRRVRHLVQVQVPKGPHRAEKGRKVRRADQLVR